jgi:hypothetical protein
MLLYSAKSVCFVKSAGTPGLLGFPKVAAPLPASTNNASLDEYRNISKSI